VTGKGPEKKGGCKRGKRKGDGGEKKGWKVMGKVASPLS